MTIAAGLICSDGIVLCADTEHSKTDAKYHRPKVFASPNNKLIVTGAGVSDYIKVGFDKLNDAMATAPADPSAARKKVEDVISKMYAQHLIPFQGNDPDYDVSLIVAMRCSGNQLALVKTVKSTAALVDQYSVIGSGFHLFEYWATYFFYKMRLDMEVAANIAIFMLREIKMAGYACGGATYIHKMPVDLQTADKKGYIFSEKRVLAEFPQSAVDVLFAAMDLKLQESVIDMRLEEFGKQVKELRKHIKEKADIKKGLYTVTAASAMMPSSDDEE